MPVVCSSSEKFQCLLLHREIREMGGMQYLGLRDAIKHHRQWKRMVSGEDMLKDLSAHFFSPIQRIFIE